MVEKVFFSNSWLIRYTYCLYRTLYCGLERQTPRRANVLNTKAKKEMLDLLSGYISEKPNQTLHVA